MKVLFCATTNQTINLIQQIANSGEGEVWTTNWNGMLAKIYHQPSAEKFVKLEVMIAHQPQDPNQAKNHHSFTFPQSLIKDDKGQLVGFLMHHIKDTVELIDIYNPKRRKLKKLEIDWHFLHYLALNISSIVAVIHQEGYVIGDIKPQNILVNSQALPTFIDVDSFQVKNPQTGQIYRCVVGTEGYTPPELIGEDFHQVEQNYAHDNFRLGVLIYQLLFSYHPFGSGIWQSGDKPDMNELIKRGIWLEGNQNFLSHSPNTMPLGIVHPLLRNCFLKCFNDGHSNPSARPSAQDWYYALSQAVNDLKICSQVDSHIHYAQDQICYWCARKNSLGIDIFELPSGIKSTAKQRFFSQQILIAKNSDDYNSDGNTYYELGEYQKAIDNYNQAIKLDPNYTHAYSNRGNAYKEIGEYQKALGNYNKAIELDPNFTYAYNNSGLAYYCLKEYKKALNNYNKAIELDFNYKDAYSNRGNAYNGLGDYQKALDNCNKAIELDSNYIHAYNGRGNAYYGLGDYQKALDSYNKAIELDSNYTYAYNGRGLAYYCLREYKKALNNYNKAIELDSNYKDAYSNRENAYKALLVQKIKRYILVLSFLIAVGMSVKKPSIFPVAYGIISDEINNQIKNLQTSYNHIRAEMNYERGRANAREKEYEKAIEDYNKAIQLNPNYINAYNSRGYAYRQLEEYQKAIDDYDKVIELDPSKENAYFVRGYAYHELGEYQKAIDDYDKVIELNPKGSNGYNNRGVAYNALGEHQTAIKNYDKAIELNPDHRYAYKNRRNALAKLKR